MNMVRNTRLNQIRLPKRPERRCADGWIVAAKNRLLRCRLLTRMRRAFVLCVSMVCLTPVLSSAQTDDLQTQPVIDSQTAIDGLLEKQKKIGELLPKFEAVTVCLEGGGGSGSGVIINKEGLILTAAHVVAKSADEGMTVRFIDGRTQRCKILGIYNPADAAMAQMIGENGPYEFAEIASAGATKLGQTVLATGHPGGYDEQRGIPLRIGHICAFAEASYASDAPLIGGDSGGPSFNMAGQVIGIHSNISGDMSVNNDIKIGVFLEHWDSLLAGEKRGGKLFEPEHVPDKLVFGASLIESSDDKPIRVRSVVPNSPADWAGLKAKDIVIAVNETKVESSFKLLKSMLDSEFGESFQLTIRRGAQEIVLDVELMTYSEMKKEQERRAASSKDDKDDTQQDLRGNSTENAEQSSTQTRRAEVSKIAQLNPSQVLLLNSGAGHESTSNQRHRERLAASTLGPPRTWYIKQDDDSDLNPPTNLQDLLERSRQNNGRLKVDRSHLRELRDRLGKRVDKLGVTGGRKLDQWGQQFKAAFAKPIANFSRAIYPVFVSGRHSAMAVRVHADGYFLSKASEVDGRKAIVQLAPENRQIAEVVKIEPELDLALLRIKNSGLPGSVHFIDFAQYVNAPAGSTDSVVKGTVCCAIGNHREIPTGFGVVSVPARALDGNTSAYLGAVTDTVSGNAGAQIKLFHPHSPAERAGLEVGDIIESFDNELIETKEDLEKVIGSRLPNEKVKLNIRRRDSWLTLPVPLGDRSKVIAMPGSREQGTDSKSTSMSRRRWGFSSGIQHDCGISPKHCGGILIDLSGRVIGLNIARAGRIRSYAIPSSLVADFVEKAMKGTNRDAASSTGERVFNGDEK